MKWALIYSDDLISKLEILKKNADDSDDRVKIDVISPSNGSDK